MGMYPDVLDVDRQVQALKLSSKAEDIWPDVVVTRSLLENARHRCFSAGRHDFMLVSELKLFAESFIGHSISDDALNASIHMLGLKVKGKGNQRVVKMPPLGRFEEARAHWNKYQIDHEKEIAQERIEMERWNSLRNKSSESKSIEL